MSDFFDTLEQQLLDAARERPARLRRARVRQAVAGAAAAAVLAVGAVGIALAAGLGGTDAGQRPQPAGPAPTPRGTSTDAVELRRFRVALLNGTAVGGLAGRVAHSLQGRGARIGTVTSAPSRRILHTAVFFRPGHRRDGALIASRLEGFRGDQLLPLPPGSATDRLTPDATVIVLVGSDLHQIYRAR